MKVMYAGRRIRDERYTMLDKSLRSKAASKVRYGVIYRNFSEKEIWYLMQINNRLNVGLTLNAAPIHIFNEN